MQSINIKDLMDRFKTHPTDLVGIDIGSTAIKAVRVKRSKDKFTVVGAEILPAPKKAAVSAEPGAEIAPTEPLKMPPKVKGKYASLAVTGQGAVIKWLSFPGAFDSAAEDKVIGSIGVENPDGYRIGYKLISEGHGKSESKVLAVALPEADAAAATMMFPVGTPAPYTLEISGLSAITSFQHGSGATHGEDSVGVVDFGTGVTTFALFNKGILAMLRRFDFGTNMVTDKVQEMLGVDRDTAQGIINDGAFDISQAVGEVMEPLIKQIMVSRDFVERRENCHVSKIYVSGGLVASRNSLDEMRSSLGLEIGTWNPFDGLEAAPDALSGITGQEWRFAAAVGACRATFEDE